MSIKSPAKDSRAKQGHGRRASLAGPVAVVCWFGRSTMLVLWEVLLAVGRVAVRDELGWRIK